MYLTIKFCTTEMHLRFLTNIIRGSIATSDIFPFVLITVIEHAYTIVGIVTCRFPGPPGGVVPYRQPGL